MTTEEKRTKQKIYWNNWINKNRQSHIDSTKISTKLRYQGFITKMQLIKLEKGCSICGYKKCVRSLVFHHIKDKKDEISIAISKGYSWEKIQNEIDKCVVLCSNCHGEVHQKLIKI